MHGKQWKRSATWYILCHVEYNQLVDFSQVKFSNTIDCGKTPNRLAATPTPKGLGGTPVNCREHRHSAKRMELSAGTSLPFSKKWEPLRDY
jgi:hypothetical protein